jgi:hypothetical protein
MLHFLNIKVECSVSQQKVMGLIFFTEMVTAEYYNEIIFKLLNKIAGFNWTGL